MRGYVFESATSEIKKKSSKLGVFLVARTSQWSGSDGPKTVVAYHVCDMRKQPLQLGPVYDSYQSALREFTAREKVVRNAA